MHFTTFAAFFLFGCIACASNTFAHQHNQELSPRAHGKTREKFRKMINLMLHLQPPAHGIDTSTTIKTFIDAVILQAPTPNLIAWKADAFKVYKPVLSPYCFQVGKQCNTAVIKAIRGTELASVDEMKKWAQAGYLLARATDKATPTTYLILKVTIPSRDSLSSEQEKELMNEALKSDPKSDVKLGTDPENFVWTWVEPKPSGILNIASKLLSSHGKWEAKVFDWNGPGDSQVPSKVPSKKGPPLAKIPRTELHDSKIGVPSTDSWGRSGKNRRGNAMR